jgi:hypothetical protein
MSPSHTEMAKRGYLANPENIPPLIYPFQYNPTELTDSKTVSWGKKREVSPTGPFAAVEGAIQNTGRLFSKANFLKFTSEGDRTLRFKLTIDGRERRPGEPQRRRNQQGNILADLAILRSFVYPSVASISDLVNLAAGHPPDPFYPQPPTALLVMGDLFMEGYITSLEINETLFNQELNPVRADVTISMTEKVDSLAFVKESIKRFGRTQFNTAYEDIGNVSF